ncbi:Two component regulator propeller [Granulicella rosea]|uniref:Two component regulator propeller n=2 Tax=Granulicella rosea TaxID=474952 RepID=A0A239JVN1_9BACT|nr:Two component regulator propeller [Granulicella rosea]
MLAPIAAWAQVGPVSQLRHTAWTSDDGLGAVYNIQQTTDGFLWLTTSRGVLRFDGVRFESVEQATFGAVQDGDILSAYAPSTGGIWLTTRSAGTLRWKDGALTVYPDRRCTPAGLIGGMVAEDGAESLWFESTSGLAHLHGSSCELMGPKNGYPGGLPRAMFIDRERTIWVVSQSGILLSKSKDQSVFRPAGSGVEAQGTAIAIRQDAVGRIWIADDGGLRLLTRGVQEKDTRASARTAAPSSRNFAFANDGSLWTVTAEGVSQFAASAVAAASSVLDAAPVESFTQAQGLTSDGISALLIDREGTVWVGTNSGLDKLRASLLRELPLPHAQEHEFGVATGADGSVWVGSRMMPLTRVAPDGVAKSFPEIARLTCLRRDRNGVIWAGVAGSSAVWRSSGDGFIQIPGPAGDEQPVVALEVDRNNDPWIYTTNGLTYRMVHGAWVNQNRELKKKIAVLGAMTSDEAGNVWFAFSDSLVKWDGGAFERFSYPSGQHNISPATMSARGNRVWLAGRGGIDLFSGGQFHPMRWKGANPVGRVSGIRETANGELWINGFSGITHIAAPALANWLRDPVQGPATEHFDTLDGLPGFSGDRLPEPSLAEARDGKLWFATTKGVASLDPRTLAERRNRLQPPVTITSVAANGQTFPGWKDAVLPKHTRNLEIDYTALSLSVPERVRFRYRLEGYDKDWQEAGARRQLFYTGLPPGHYRMHVTACNNDGVWSDAGASIGLTLLPAYYQTMWFRTLCGVLLLIAGWGAYRFRMEQLATALRLRFNERLEERARLARDLHDTLLQTIQASKFATDQALERSTDMAGMKTTLQQLSEWLGRAVAEGRGALQALHTSNTETNDLAGAIRMAIAECVRSSMQVDFTVEGSARDMHPIVRDEIFRIAYEAIRNACMHADATLLTVQLRYAQDLTLRIMDNGKGIEPQVLKEGKDGHYGLSSIRERADRIGATLDLKTVQPGGTEILLTVAGKAIFLTKGS